METTAFTEYKFDPEYLATLTAEKAAGLKANTGKSDLLGYGLAVVARRLEKDARRYRDYGVYWWALKSLLRNAGLLVGDQTDPLIEREYKGATALETLVAADEFRSQYLATFFVYTNEFQLSADSPEPYRLFDFDMEQDVI